MTFLVRYTAGVLVFGLASNIISGITVNAGSRVYLLVALRFVLKAIIIDIIYSQKVDLNWV